MLLGLASGLAAATLQSTSYLATRHFVQRRGEGASRDLLILSHIIMGIASVVALPFLWPAEGIDWSHTLRPLLGTALFYLIGQVGLMLALKHAEASRVSPLLGFKIVILAVLATIFGSPHQASAPGLSLLQWFAVILCVIAAILLTNTGGRLKSSAILGIIVACIAYSLSDWHIALLGNAIRSTTSLNALAPITSTALCYALSGLIGLCFFPFIRDKQPATWRDASPFAFTWLLAMVALFTCFAFEGPVLGNILQSTRGLISVGLAAVIAHRGHHHIEAHTPRNIFIRRLLAAMLMFGAIALYVLGKPA